MGDGTASSAIADIGLRIIKEKEARITELEAALKSVVDVWYGAERERRLPDAMDVAFRALRKSDPK